MNTLNSIYIYIHVQICSNCMCFEFYIQRFCETSLNESMNGKMISGQFNNVVLNDSSINGTSTNETDGWQLVLGGFSIGTLECQRIWGKLISIFIDATYGNTYSLIIQINIICNWFPYIHIHGYHHLVYYIDRNKNISRLIFHRCQLVFHWFHQNSDLASQSWRS